MGQDKDIDLVIVSVEFPFGSKEVFLEKEINEFSKKFKTIHLFPQTKCNGLQTRKIPDNCILHLDITDITQAPKKQIFTNILTIIRILSIEFFYSGRPVFILFSLRRLIVDILYALHKSNLFFNSLKKYPKNNKVFYSVWMDEAALMLSILKAQRKIPNFVVRLHGHDLFEERKRDHYMPFRSMIFKFSTRIFILSKFGYEYLKKKVPKYKRKYEVNYSGLYDCGDNPINKTGVYTIVSCSNLIPLKRVDVIARAIGMLNIPVKWIHFGDGPEMDSIVNITESYPSWINAELRGHVQNIELLEFYRKTAVDLFVHVSESEGLGMAIVEAQSFGVPVIVSDAQGTAETFSEESGLLIPNQCNPDLLHEKINLLLADEELRLSMRKRAKAFFLTNFEANKNYTEFISRLVDVTLGRGNRI